MIENIVYNLQPEKTTIGIQISFNGQNHHLNPITDFVSVFRDYHNVIHNLIKQQAEELYPVVDEQEMKKKILEENLKIFTIKNFELSLVRNAHNSYTVCRRVPSFINKGDDGEYYHFPETRVGVYVTYNQGAFSVSSPIVVGTYRHMFTVLGVTNSTICTNSYSCKTNTAQSRVAELLAVGYNVITRGYLGDVRPINRLNKSTFEKEIIDSHRVQELAKRGIVITNG